MEGADFRLLLRALQKGAETFAETLAVGLDRSAAPAPLPRPSASASSAVSLVAETPTPPADPVVLCPLCEKGGLQAVCQHAPKSGKSWYRCENGHYFDRTKQY